MIQVYFSSRKIDWYVSEQLPSVRLQEDPIITNDIQGFVPSARPLWSSRHSYRWQLYPFYADRWHCPHVCIFTLHSSCWHFCSLLNPCMEELISPGQLSPPKEAELYKLSRPHLCNLWFRSMSQMAWRDQAAIFQSDSFTHKHWNCFFLFPHFLFPQILGSLSTWTKPKKTIENKN